MLYSGGSSGYIFLDISFCHDGFFKVNPLSLTLFANFEF